MYVTRPMSMYRRQHEALSITPQLEGPNSGYLVIFNEDDYELKESWTGSSYKDNTIRDLPFPQNKILKVEDDDFYQDVLFIPVLNHPLSSNLYYAIVQEGNHIGEAYTSSKKKESSTSIFGSYIKDVKPKPLDPCDQYQQVEITQHRHGFTATSIASDGFPPYFLRNKHWSVEMCTPKYYKLSQALGLNSTLRATLPPFNTTQVVGKWYCPFMFVEEVMKLKDQMKRSMFYEMTLEQRWVRVFECGNEGNLVFVNVVVETEDVFIVGGIRKAIWDEKNVNTNKVVWFMSERVGEDCGIGLNAAIVDRMKWEQERVGWVRDRRKGRVVKAYEYDGLDEWTSFGCYILVESFVLRRMDGSLALTYDFKHTHQIRCKWE
ncbi:uncharacterized protein LOC115699034 [Cannabis sativa]|uniref:uncharacterized protein LOC115699034 n=1 Tax=Cannabis sativa TaxID=3483 RepID=UPI0029CA7ADD|nr:uncharacterized protein LOC115699034 [Cannabis sativa]